MKVYGVTDDNLDALEQTHWSAAGLFGAAMFALGLAINIVTSAAFQERLTPVSWVFILFVAPLCLFASATAAYFAFRYEQSRKSKIAQIKSQSVYIDPNNEKVMRLYAEIKSITGTNI